MRRRPATAKINLALVVGARRDDGMHEVATVLQRVDLADRITVRPAERLVVRGFPEDSLVARALSELVRTAGVEVAWDVRIDKRIPVAAGLGGGSSDAATALRLANETLPEPLPIEELSALAATLGADVPFFLTQGPQLGEGDGTDLTPLDLPQDYYVLLVVPRAAEKRSTAAVYDQFDRRGHADGFAGRHRALSAALGAVDHPRDLAALPANDLASSPLADQLLALGAFRADVSGAGPTVYALFARRDAADSARRAVDRLGRTWLTVPAWYG